ncbi:MAG: hypothetical protein ABSE20_05020 [Acetobacteraceae bacterium]|jgi:hypothetical protein
MTLRLTRRAVLLMPLLLAACGGEEEAPAPEAGGDFPPLRYGYLPPIKLNVQRIETAKRFVPPIDEDEMIGFSPVDPIDTLYAMARDRLQPVAQSGTATFRVLTASITRHHDTLNGVLAVRLDVRDGDNTGFVVARVTAHHSGEITSQRAAVYDLLKTMMFQMNVELEYQLRNKLKAWVVNAQAEPGPAPQAQPAPPAALPEPTPDAPPEAPQDAAPEPPPADVPPPQE